MKVCIISGRYPNTTFDSVVNHKVYADTFGYSYIHCNWPTTASNLYFNKIYYLLAYVDKYDYLIWIDDDAFFVDFEKDIMDFKPRDKNFLSICSSPTFKELFTFISSGQFILKSNATAKQFLKDILNQDLKKIKAVWTEKLGYFTNGDQDAMVYLLKTDRSYKGKFDLWDYKKFNSRFENLENKDKHYPLILHFTGTIPVKNENYTKAQSLLKRKANLVPEELLVGYGIRSQAEKMSLRKKIQKKIGL
jgi:hypothetical protein